MAQVVVVVIAGIAGFGGYREAAKFETRFRKGPLGIPARAWGVVCFFVGLVGALLASALVIGVFIGFVAYNEAAKYERQNGEDPLGIPPWGLGVLCASFGAIGALTTSAFPIGVLIGFVGYTEAATYERQYDKRALRASSVAWGVVWFLFGLIGALVTSALAWGVVCSFFGLIGALLLLIAERNALIAEKNALIAERNALTAERNLERRVGASSASPAPDRSVAAAPPPRQWGSPPQRPSSRSDFLPRRR
jgi:hypothetical protein